MRTRSRWALVVGVAALALAGCGDGGAEDPDGASPTGAPTPRPSVTAPPRLTPPPGATPPGTVPGPPSPSRPPSGELTVSGRLVDGVEPGCLLLETDHGQLYLLFGEPADELRAEATATVRGVARPDMASTCQQGIPFQVHEVVD